MAALPHRKFVAALKSLLMQGISPQELALSLACGIVLGVFPVMGSTTLLCALATLTLRLNPAAIQLVNYVMYPVQLALILPFIRAGQWLMHSQQTRMTLAQMLQVAKTDHAQAFHLLWRMALQGVAAWVLFAAVVMPLLYWVLLKTIAGIQRQAASRRPVAEAA